MTADIGPHITAARKLECELDGLYFFRYFFKQRTGAKALINWHHHLLNDTLERVLKMEIPRLIISLPPGYTKTELAVINFMARGLALNHRSRFLHLSYSDKLAMLNSSTTRDIVRSEPYQEMWPMTIRNDTDSKSLWWTEQGGGVYATSTRGQVTGFRAGQMDTFDKFTGALILDDALKPRDALTVERKNVNDSFNDTVQSRLAHQRVPIIVIMQRLAYEDLAGYLLMGGSGDKWHHLELPVDFPLAPYPKEWTHGIPIKYEPPTDLLWEAKHNEEDVKILKTKPRLYHTQYKQRPKKGNELGTLWKDETIEIAHSLESKGDKSRTVVAVDPSVTSNDSSDECGIIVASRYDCRNVMNQEDMFEVQADYTSIMSPQEWAEKSIYAYEVHDADAIVVETNQGGDLIELTLRNMGFTGSIIKVHAKKGKYLRAEPVAPFYSQKRVRHRENLTDLEDEMLEFRVGMTDSPNRVDALVYALTELSQPTGCLGW